MINILMRSIQYAKLYFIHRLETKNDINDYLNSSITDYIVDKNVKFQKQLLTNNNLSNNEISPVTSIDFLALIMKTLLIIQLATIRSQEELRFLFQPIRSKQNGILDVA